MATDVPAATFLSDYHQYRAEHDGSGDEPDRRPWNVAEQMEETGASTAHAAPPASQSRLPSQRGALDVGAQTFVTATHTGVLPELGDALVLRVAQGRVTHA